jgi:hypothetical protein
MSKASSQKSAESPAYRSLALGALLQQLEVGRPHTILDLGPALSGNLKFWSPYASRICFEDFYRTWEEFGCPVPTDGAFDDLTLQELFLFDRQDRFDIILAWDLFNYFEPDQTRAIASFLSGYCRAGGLLFALFSSSPTLPSRPIRFRILSTEQVTYENIGSGSRPCPRYQPRDVARMMSGFQVLNSFLLRHGIQEYLFSRQEGSGGVSVTQRTAK